MVGKENEASFTSTAENAGKIDTHIHIVLT